MDVKKNQINIIENNFLELFLKNIDFAKTYICMYYPFSYREITDNWDMLIHGEAFYTDCIVDELYSLFIPKFGLCFNKNIKWNSKLRAKWDYGLYGPFVDADIIGIDKNLEIFSDISYYDIMIPLDTIKCLESYFSCIDTYEANYCEEYHKTKEDLDYQKPENYESTLEIYKKEYGQLTYLEFEKIFYENNRILFYNESIWKNTLKNVINEDFIKKIFPSIILDQNSNLIPDQDTDFPF